MKNCGGCNQALDESAFWKNKRMSDGLQCQCKECMRPRTSEWAAKNPIRVRELQHRFRKESPKYQELVRRGANARLSYKARKLKSDPTYALHTRVAQQIRAHLRGAKCARTSESLVGYTFDELRMHLERQFTKGMSWDNMVEWHIDHIVPLSSFKISGPDDAEFRRAWSLANLRPLWATENRAKSDTITHLI